MGDEHGDRGRKACGSNLDILHIKGKIFKHLVSKNLMEQDVADTLSEKMLE